MPLPDTARLPGIKAFVLATGLFLLFHATPSLASVPSDPVLQEVTHTRDMRLKGPVRQVAVHYYHFEVKDQTAVVGKENFSFGLRHAVLEFNKDGTISKYTGLDEHHKKDLVRTYQYNDKGLPVRMKSGSKDGPGNFTRKTRYNDHGDPVEQTLTLPGGRTRDHLVFRYNDQHQLVERVEIRPFHATTHYTYDDQGRKIKAVQKAENGDVISTETYAYDASGNVIQKVLAAYQDGKVTHSAKIEKEYNSANRVTKRTVYDTQGVETYHTLFKYTAEGLLDSLEKHYPGRRSPHKNYFFTVTDDHGNWIERYDQSSRGRQVMKERIIEYYGGPEH